MKKLPVVAVTLMLLSGTVKADFNDGVVALMMGDYATALQTFVPLAETSDHAFAQYFLARMYAAGQGVELDAKVAADWYRLAAEKGVADAQYRLGMSYEIGEGVPADLEYAFAWFSVAGHLGNTKGMAGAERSHAQLSDVEKVEAEKLSRDLIQKYGQVKKGAMRAQ